jgi:hypothetical protein
LPALHWHIYTYNTVFTFLASCKNIHLGHPGNI